MNKGEITCYGGPGSKLNMDTALKFREIVKITPV